MITATKPDGRRVVETPGRIAIERAEWRAPSSWLARLIAAIFRLLLKLAFFYGMMGLGLAIMVWLPPLPGPPGATVGDVLIRALGLSGLVMLFVGIMGSGYTVVTLGRRP